MRAVIVGNGDIKDYSIFDRYRDDDNLIICCDGGMRHTFYEGIIPDYILGDLDSAPKQIIEFYHMQNVQFRQFPIKKNSSDLELGILFAIEKGAEEIVILGAIGNRFDHTLVNAHILMNATQRGIKAYIINENNIIYLINKEINLQGEIGDLVSLVPLTSEVEGVTTEGLEYPLENYTMKVGCGASLGISNVFCEKNVRITVSNGYLFVIQAKD